MITIHPKHLEIVTLALVHYENHSRACGVRARETAQFALDQSTREHAEQHAIGWEADRESASAALRAINAARFEVMEGI